MPFWKRRRGDLLHGGRRGRRSSFSCCSFESCDAAIDNMSSGRGAGLSRGSIPPSALKTRMRSSSIGQTSLATRPGREMGSHRWRRGDTLCVRRPDSRHRRSADLGSSRGCTFEGDPIYFETDLCTCTAARGRLSDSPIPPSPPRRRLE